MPYFPPPSSGDFRAFDSTGALTETTKVWRGRVTSNGNGVFTIDYSSAGFTEAPRVEVSAESLDTDTVRDRAWATLRGTPTASSASGYTLRGQLIVAIVVGGAFTVRTAPNTAVNVIAIGK